MADIYRPRKLGQPTTRRRDHIQSSLRSEDKREFEEWMERHRINCVESLRWLVSMAVVNDWDPWEEDGE